MQRSTEQNLPDKFVLPYAHPKIRLDDLTRDDKDGQLKLHSRQEIEFLQRVFSGEENKRYSKEEIRELITKKNLSSEYQALGGNFIKYGIVKNDDELFAIYRGVNQGEAVGSGNFGKAKLMQNLATGEMGIVKVVNTKNYMDQISGLRGMIETENKEIKNQEAKLQDPHAHKSRIKKTIAQHKKNIIELESRIAEIKNEMTTEARNLQELKLQHFFIDERVSKEGTPHQIIGMKLAAGLELWKAIDKEGDSYSHYISPMQLLHIAKSMVKATKHLHDANKIHRDIKPENYVLDPRWAQVKLIDHGFTATVKGKNKDFRLEGSPVGTDFYMAPELFLKKKPVYTEASEVYALGMSIAQMFHLTFETEVMVSKYYDDTRRLKVADENHPLFLKNMRLPADPALRKEILDFLHRMTSDNPKNRPTLIEANDFLNKMILGSRNTEIKIATISIDDFTSATDQIRMKMVKELQQRGIHAVAFTDSSRKDDKAYIEVQRFLAKYQIINIAPFVFTGTNQEVLNRNVSDHFANQFQAKTELYTFAADHALRKTDVKPIEVVFTKPATRDATPAKVPLAQGKAQTTFLAAQHRLFQPKEKEPSANTTTAQWKPAKLVK